MFFESILNMLFEDRCACVFYKPDFATYAHYIFIKRVQLVECWKWEQAWLVLAFPCVGLRLCSREGFLCFLGEVLDSFGATFPHFHHVRQKFFVFSFPFHFVFDFVIFLYMQFCFEDVHCCCSRSYSIAIFVFVVKVQKVSLLCLFCEQTQSFLLQTFLTLTLG